MPKWLALLAIGIIWLVLGGEQRPVAADPPRVAVSVFPLYDVARRVAGDRLQVDLMLPPGRSPHDYEPTPAEAARVAKARLVVVVGLGFDTWLERLARTVAGPQVTILALGPHVHPLPLVPGPAGRHVSAATAVAYDPHFWLDPLRMPAAIDAIAAAYARLDPAGADHYRRQAATVKQDVVTLHRQIASRAAAWPKRPLVTLHRSLDYFAARYGLTIAAVIEAIPGVEPTAQDLAQVIETAKRTGSAAILAEPQLDLRPAQLVAEETGLTLYLIDPEGSSPQIHAYDDLLNRLADVIEKALQ